MSWKKLSCSFCNKPKEEVKRLISGSKVYICEGCVTTCVGILLEQGVSVVYTAALESLVLASPLRSAVDALPADSTCGDFLAWLEGAEVKRMVLEQKLRDTRQRRIDVAAQLQNIRAEEEDIEAQLRQVGKPES